MTTKTDDARYLVPGLQRGIEILRLFSRHRSRITAPEMARELGIPRSTVFRLVQTLEHLGLLESDDGGRGHRLGVGLLSLGFEYVAGLDVAEVGGAEVEALRDETGHAAHLVVRDGTDVIVVFKAPGKSAFSGSLNVGARLPAHATVLGRVLLADLDQVSLRELYRGKALEVFSEHTPATVADLAVIVAQDRARGYAVSRSFFESGISSVAAPVRDHTGSVVAAINVTLTGEADVPEPVITAVRQCADTVSALLNFRPENTSAMGM